MERDTLRRLKEKKFLKPDDLQLMFLLCDFLIAKNDDQARQLRAALKKIDELEGRVSFYRSATFKGL